MLCVLTVFVVFDCRDMPTPRHYLRTGIHHTTILHSQVMCCCWWLLVCYQVLFPWIVFAKLTPRGQGHIPLTDCTTLFVRGRGFLGLTCLLALSAGTYGIAGKQSHCALLLQDYEYPAVQGAIGFAPEWSSVRFVR